MPQQHVRAVSLALPDGTWGRKPRRRSNGGGNYNTFDPATLVSPGTALGLPAPEMLEVLHGDRHADAVKADQVRAVNLGATGVPFTVIADRIVFPGSATTAQYGSAIEQAWQDHGILAGLGSGPEAAWLARCWLGVVASSRRN